MSLVAITAAGKTNSRRPTLRKSSACPLPELVSDELLAKFSLVGTAKENAERIHWLFDNRVYPIVYPLPRLERMAEDQTIEVFTVDGVWDLRWSYDCSPSLRNLFRKVDIGDRRPGWQTTRA